MKVDSRPQKIGIFRALHLGDLLCIIPAVRSIRAACPDAEITMIGLPWQQQFVERFQHYFNRFVEFPGWPDLPEQVVDVRELPDFLQRMQQEQFDLLFQMQGNGIGTNLMCTLFGAKQLAGLRRHDEWCPDENLFPVSEDTDHEVLRFMKLVNALDIPSAGTDLEFPILSNEHEAAKRYLEKWKLSDKPFVCVHPGARDPRRRWSPDAFAEVADMLAAMGFAIILTGSEFEADILHSVASKMTNICYNLVDDFGQISIGELAAIMNHSAALLSNDTGVSHVASALEIPSVVLFSSYSRPERWAPLDDTIHKVLSHADAANHQFVAELIMDIASKSMHSPQAK